MTPPHRLCSILTCSGEALLLDPFPPLLQRDKVPFFPLLDPISPSPPPRFLVRDLSVSILLRVRCLPPFPNTQERSFDLQLFSVEGWPPARFRIPFPVTMTRFLFCQWLFRSSTLGDVMGC